MKWRFPIVCTVYLAAFFFALAAGANAQSAQAALVSHDAVIDGSSIHYTTAGSGPVVILLHGFAETSRMWNPILPVLGKEFSVIAPDLPGIGDSAIAGGEMDMKKAAVQIHDLARSLVYRAGSLIKGVINDMCSERTEDCRTK